MDNLRWQSYTVRGTAESMGEATRSTFVRFGTFEADLEAGELRRAGRRVPLQARPFQILAVLLEHPGELVTRQSLRERLWPADVFVDFDHSLNTSIRKLRGALGDEASTPRFVETVDRRGYRFIAPVTPAGDAADRPVSAAPASPLASDARMPAVSGVSRRWLAGALTIAIAVIVVAVVSVRRSASSVGAAVTSIAVLPFHPLQLDERDQYLGIGIADAVITRLSTLQQVIVRPTAAVRKYADPAQDPLAAGRELRVDAVLEGSIQRLDGRVRVTARLVRTADGHALWSGQIDEKISDLLNLEDAIAGRTASAVLSTLTASDEQKLSAHDTTEQRAYEAYLKGRYFASRRAQDDLLKAIESFEAAIAADARYARAYSGLADTYMLVSGYGYMSPDVAIPKARTAAQRAVALMPHLAEPHASLALLAENIDWDWPLAEREYLTAIAADPNYATAHHWYGEYLSLLGRFDEALVEIGKARALDPLSLSIRRDLGFAYFYAQQYERAIDEEQQALEIDPTFDLARGVLATVYLTQGRFAETEVELNKLRLPDDGSMMISAWGQVFAREGRRDEALDAIARLNEIAKHEFVSPMQIAWVHLALGQNEQALDCIERAVKIHDAPLTSLKVAPNYDPIRQHPRFLAALRQVRLDR